MRRICFSIFLFAFLALQACKGKDEKTAPSAPATVDIDDSTASRFTATGWPEDAGPIVVLPASGGLDLKLVLPELTDQTFSDTSSFVLDSLPGGAIELFPAQREKLLATISGGASEESVQGCKSWPTGLLTQSVSAPWRVGVAAGVAEEIPLGNWGQLLAEDSIVAGNAAVKMAESSGRDSSFFGIPFSLRYLQRIEITGTRVFVADAMRRINTEANVREEHVFVIGEAGHGSRNYAEAYRDYRMGREDEVQVPGILAAVRLGENRRPALFVSLEYRDGSRVLLIERISAARWILKWKSAYAGC